MKLINNLNRPEYILNPIQIYRRLSRPLHQNTHEFEEVKLPWGIKIKIRPQEVLGRSVWVMGVYDLSVSEILWRLIDPGELAIDVGANIGYMTSIMAKRVGQTGKVWCFEPHPEVYQELTENLKRWQEDMGWHQIKAHPIALSNQSGEGGLNIPTTFEENRGLASLVSSDEVVNIPSFNGIAQTFTVPLATLDEVLPTKDKIGVLKVDVEGYELEVLQGASGLITQQQIRDIIFEDHRNYPNPVSNFLEAHGYRVFRIGKGFWKPRLDPPTQRDVSPDWEPPSYLATKDPQRAIQRLNNRGWNVLSGSI